MLFASILLHVPNTTQHAALLARPSPYIPEERSSEQEGRDGQGKNVTLTSILQPLLVWNYFLTVILQKEKEMGGEQREKALDFTHILL